MKKRSQIQSQIFVYLLVTIIIGFMLLFAYKTIAGFSKKSIEHQMILFQENINKDVDARVLHVGSIGEESYVLPTFITRACFVDVSKREEALSEGFFDAYPLIIDSLETTDNNMFLFDEDDNLYNSFNIGQVTLLSDYNCQPYTCFDTKNNVLRLMMMGTGKSTLFLPYDANNKYLIACDCPRGCSIQPIANLTFGEEHDTETSVAGMQYLSVFFNADSSYDVDDHIVEYFWQFGDGDNETTEEPITEHVYSDAQDYEVTLTVIDVDGFEGTTQQTITIENYQLIANAGGDKTGKVAEEVGFDASNSMGRIISYNWFFGDIRNKGDEGKIVGFRYLQHGIKLVTLNVTDVFGNSAIDTINVEVTN